MCFGGRRAKCEKKGGRREKGEFEGSTPRGRQKGEGWREEATRKDWREEGDGEKRRKGERRDTYRVQT